VLLFVLGDPTAPVELVFVLVMLVPELSELFVSGIVARVSTDSLLLDPKPVPLR
jgi:hypothetical protein